MQEDFHYYATYCAAFIAGYTHEECMDICYSAQFVDLCSKSFLSGIGAPLSAATTQLQLELMDVRTDIIGLQDITRIWASFHFLPKDLYAVKKWCSKKYKNKYRLICGPNGELLAETVKLAKNTSLQAVGTAMHVLADTWAHMYFAGTPSLVINNTDYYFYELIPEGDGYTEKHISFKHSPKSPDNPDKCFYVGSLYQMNENSIMNLGHGRAGHLPDYSFMHYKYLPAWNGYKEVVKDNPSDYYKAFCQMVYAMKYLRGDIDSFKTDTYAYDEVAPYEGRIKEILNTRQLSASEDFKKFGEELSGKVIEKFDVNKYKEEYVSASGYDKDRTFLGKFIIAALSQKSMVTNKIYKSGNRLAGVSVDYKSKGFKGIKDFAKLISLRRNWDE